MKYLLILVVLLTGCSSEVDSRSVLVAQTLCFDREGVSSITLDPIGSDIYICMDGSQFLIGYGTRDGENVHYIKHNQRDAKSNETVDRILSPEKWAKKDHAARQATKAANDNRPAEQVVNEILHPTETLMGDDRGL